MINKAFESIRSAECNRRLEQRTCRTGFSSGLRLPVLSGHTQPSVVMTTAGLCVAAKESDEFKEQRPKQETS